MFTIKQQYEKQSKPYRRLGALTEGPRWEQDKLNSSKSPGVWIHMSKSEIWLPYTDPTPRYPICKDTHPICEGQLVDADICSMTNPVMSFQSITWDCEKGMSSLSLILLVRVRLRSYTYTGKYMANTVTGSNTIFAVGMMSTQMKWCKLMIKPSPWLLRD